MTPARSLRGVLLALDRAKLMRGHREVAVANRRAARQAIALLRKHGWRPRLIAPRRGPVELIVPTKGTRVNPKRMPATYLAHGRGTSIRAGKATERGLLPLSKIHGIGRQWLRLAADIVGPEEWHHTGGYARETNFYDAKKVLAVARAMKAQDATAEKISEKRAVRFKQHITRDIFRWAKSTRRARAGLPPVNRFGQPAYAPGTAPHPREFFGRRRTNPASWPDLDHSMMSPSGHISARARRAALERARVELFGKGGLPWPKGPPQPSEVDYLRRQARELSELAARGMKPRAYAKKAAELRAQADALEASGKANPSPHVKLDLLMTAWARKAKAKAKHQGPIWLPPQRHVVIDGGEYLAPTMPFLEAVGMKAVGVNRWMA